jgi:prevent-host-death family protein
MTKISVDELRSRTTELLDGDEPVIVTRNGKNAAVIYPIHDPEKIPLEIKRVLFLEAAERVGSMIPPDVTDEDIERDFAAFKQQHRRRQ